MYALNITHYMKVWQSAGSGFFNPDDMNALQSCCVHVHPCGQRRIWFVAPDCGSGTGDCERVRIPSVQRNHELHFMLMHAYGIMIPICGCGLVWSVMNQRFECICFHSVRTDSIMAIAFPRYGNNPGSIPCRCSRHDG